MQDMVSGIRRGTWRRNAVLKHPWWDTQDKDQVGRIGRGDLRRLALPQGRWRCTCLDHHSVYCLDETGLQFYSRSSQNELLVAHKHSMSHIERLCPPRFPDQTSVLHSLSHHLQFETHIIAQRSTTSCINCSRSHFTCQSPSHYIQSISHSALLLSSHSARQPSPVGYI